MTEQAKVLYYGGLHEKNCTGCGINHAVSFAEFTQPNHSNSNSVAAKYILHSRIFCGFLPCIMVVELSLYGSRIVV
jgi:hypothetical protein